MRIIDPIGAFLVLISGFLWVKNLLSTQKAGQYPVIRGRSIWFSRPPEDAVLSWDEAKVTELHTPLTLPAPPNTSSLRELLEKPGTSQQRAGPAVSHLSGREEALGHPVVGLRLFSRRTCMNN